MKAKELMIGDWVRWVHIGYSGVVVYNGYKKVDAIYGDESVDLIDEDTLYDNVPMYEVHAVELTEKILKKNADIVEEWMNTEEIWAWRANNDENASVIFHQREGWRTREKGTPIVRCYVHKLQHALRLCGIEKEIVL